MKLSKAQEILELNVLEAGKQMPPDTLIALILGIAALTRIIACREPDGGSPLPPLAGETPEYEPP